METLKLFRHLVILIFLLSFSNSFAEEYTRWHLPEGGYRHALEKGEPMGVSTYFPDGTRLAVRSSIGILDI